MKVKDLEIENNTQDKTRVRELYGTYAQEYSQHYSNPKTLFDLEKQQRLRLVRENIKRLQSSSILDLGCGPGYTTSHIADEMPASEVIGLDFSSEMIEVANNFYAQKASYFHGDAEDLPFENERFSIVFALGVMEKFINPVRVFQECKRVLASGGYLFFTYPNKHSLLRLLNWSVRSLIGDITENPDKYIAPAKELQDGLSQMDFHVLDKKFITYGNGFIFWPWSKTVNLIAEKCVGRNFVGQTVAFTGFWTVQKPVPNLKTIQDAVD